MVEWFRNFESDLTSMTVENYMNAKDGFRVDALSSLFDWCTAIYSLGF